MSTPLIGPDGKKYTLTDDAPEALERARAEGFHVEGEKSPHDIAEQEAQAAEAGVARGATFGLSDAALGAGGAEEQASLKRLEAENPKASMAGELVGAVASPFNAVGAAVEGPRALTVAGRLGQKVLGGAAVGGLYGAGQTVSDAALGDPEITADKLIGHVGLGALLGGTGGGLGGAIEEGVAGLMPKLAKASSHAQSVLDDIANDAAVKSTKATQAVVNRLGEPRVTEVGQMLRDRGHLRFSPEEILKSVTADAAKTGAEKGAFLDAAEAAGQKPSFANLRAKLDAFEASKNPLEQDSIAGDLEAARSAIDELGARPATATGKGGSGFRALDDLKQTIQSKARFSRGPAGVDDVALSLKRELAGVFREELDQQLIPALGKDADAFLASKRTYGLLKDAQRLAESGAGRAGGIGLKDLAASIIGGGFHPGIGIAAGIGHKLLREYGPTLIAKTAGALSKSSTLNAVAQSFAKAIPTTAPKLGAYGPALLNALATSPENALATHMVLAQVDPNYAATIQTAGLTPEGPAEHAAALEKAHGVVQVGTAANETGKAISRHLDAVMRGSGGPTGVDAHASQDFGTKRMRRDPLASHKQAISEARELAANPSALVDRVAQNLKGVGPVAPAVSAALVARAQVAVQYLTQHGATSPPAGPMAREPVPSDADMYAYARKVAVVRQPVQAVMSHAARGTLTRADMDTLKAVYPSLAKEIENKTMERVAEGKKDVPYTSRMMLSILTGIDVDGTTSPAAIRANQLAMQEPSKKSQDTQKPDAKALNGAERMGTPSQKRELQGRET